MSNWMHIFTRPKEAEEPAPEPTAPAWPRPLGDTSVLVVFFDDIKGSTAMKETLASSQNEQAYHVLRHEHDELLREVITRDNAGHVVKSTGDGVLALFLSPSVAVERAMEIQERLHGHRQLSVRIGLDMGEIQVEYEGDSIKDVFGRHVDWAARVMEMGDGGHICVTKPVYTDAFSWITKTRIAWKEHGAYRLKPGEPPLEVFEPYNANLTQSLSQLRGDKIAAQSAPTPAAATPAAVPPVRVVTSWEEVAQEGQNFADGGTGTMYWFKPTLGDICYPEGFRSFLAPALANPRITKIRFILDSSTLTPRRVWQHAVLPQIQSWAGAERRKFRLYQREAGGQYVESPPGKKAVQWIAQDLSGEYAAFKLFVDDPMGEAHADPAAQILLSTLPRNVRFPDGTLHEVRIPEAVTTLTSTESPTLIQVLTEITSQWGSLFP